MSSGVVRYSWLIERHLTTDCHFKTFRCLRTQFQTHFNIWYFTPENKTNEEERAMGTEETKQLIKKRGYSRHARRVDTRTGENSLWRIQTRRWIGTRGDFVNYEIIWMNLVSFCHVYFLLKFCLALKAVCTLITGNEIDKVLYLYSTSVWLFALPMEIKITATQWCMIHALVKKIGSNRGQASFNGSLCFIQL